VLNFAKFSCNWYFYQSLKISSHLLPPSLAQFLMQKVHTYTDRLTLEKLKTRHQLSSIGWVEDWLKDKIDLKISNTICIPCSVHVRTMFVQHCLHGTKNGVFYEQGTKEVRTKPNIGVSVVPALTGIPINFSQLQSKFWRPATSSHFVLYGYTINRFFNPFKKNKMETIRNGGNGAFSGKIGTVTGSTCDGIQYMRSLPKSSTKAARYLQLAQRPKFGFANGFLGPIGSPFCQLSFCPISMDYFPFKTILPIKSKSQSSAQIPIKKLTLRFLLKAPKKNVQ
jgi:hypothetical protein